MADTRELVRENVYYLKQAESLIGELSDSVYGNNQLPPFFSGVGMHLRHILDFYRAFLSMENGRVDYDKRQRAPEVEYDRSAAVDAIRSVIRSLTDVSGDSDHPVMSKNDDSGQLREPSLAFYASTVGRELRFLVSHTVHHFAIIAMLLSLQGQPWPKGFGVAPSTLKHWAQSESKP